MDNLLLSIILPIYNVENYLDRCMESILVQKFQNCEIILVDDGSTDSSGAIADSYTEKSENIKVIHKINGGLSSARNAGLEIARGEYIFFIDSDDWIEEGSLQLLADILYEHKVDVLKFNYIARPSNKKFITTIPNGIYEKKYIEDIICKEALTNTGNINFSAWSHIYNRKFLEDTKISFVSEREIGSEDYLFNFQVYLETEKMIVIPNCLYNYDCRDGSLTQRYRNNLFEQYRKLYNYMCKVASNNGKYEKLKNDLYNFYIWKTFHVVLRNEGKINQQHKFMTGLKNTRMVLRQKELRDALVKYDSREEDVKGKSLIFFMKLHISLIIYIWLWLSVKK